MSLTNAYATLADVKAASASVAAHGTANDSVLERCIEAASRGVDQYTHRRFYTDGTAEVLDFFAAVPGIALVHPRTEPATITVVYPSAQQDFRVGPASAAVPGMLGGLLELHRRHGSLPLADVVAPSVELARAGAVVDEAQAYVLTLIEAIALVILVIFLFLLHLRSTLVPVLSLPVAVALAFIPMHAMGLNANLMSLAGIAISIGVLDARPDAALTSNGLGSLVNPELAVPATGCSAGSARTRAPGRHRNRHRRR